MGVVPHWEQPVSHRETQVVLVELDQGRVELRGFAHIACKGISLELKPATQDCQTEGQELQKEISKYMLRSSINTWNNAYQSYTYLIVWGEDELEDNHQAY